MGQSYCRKSKMSHYRKSLFCESMWKYFPVIFFLSILLFVIWIQSIGNFSDFKENWSELISGLFVCFYLAIGWRSEMKIRAFLLIPKTWNKVGGIRLVLTNNHRFCPKSHSEKDYNTFFNLKGFVLACLILCRWPPEIWIFRFG